MSSEFPQKQVVPGSIVSLDCSSGTSVWFVTILDPKIQVRSAVRSAKIHGHGRIEDRIGIQDPAIRWVVIKPLIHVASSILHDSRGNSTRGRH